MKPRVFLMDTWAYPYRLPIFEALSQKVSLQAFFSRPLPFDHLDSFSLDQFKLRYRQGNLLFACIPVHLLWEEYDAYFVGQIGIQAVPGALFTMLIAKLKDKPLVLWTDFIETEHYVRYKPIKKIFGDIVRKIFLSQCKAAMAFGYYTENYITRITKNKVKIFNVKQVVPETCSPEIHNFTRNEHYQDRVVVLCMSYMRPGKGVDLLVDAFIQLNHPHATLVLCGPGSEKEKLEKKAKAAGADIEFPGFVENLEKAKKFYTADLFVMPSDHETWGLAINEAMYYGLPVIVTDACGGHELVQGNGRVVPARDSVAMQEALKELINDTELRKKMSQRSKAIISQYDLHYGVDSFMQVIRYVTAEKTP